MKLLCTLLGHRINPTDDLQQTLSSKRCRTVLAQVPDEPAEPTDKTYTHGCKGKIRYPDFKAANETLERLPRRPLTLNAYPCQHCGGWHLGNHRRKRKCVRR